MQKNSRSQGLRKIILTSQLIKNFMPKRESSFYKNMFGHVLVVGGSKGLTGAPILSGIGALKSGAGLVTVATWPHSYEEMMSRLPLELMGAVIPLRPKDRQSFFSRLSSFSSIVIGPGLGTKADTRKIVLNLLEKFSGPIILDADALNILKFPQDHSLFNKRKFPTVFTPHGKEFSRLMGVNLELIQKSPEKYLKILTEQTGSIVVLKGPCTYISGPQGKIYFHDAPNDGMATAGMGDVLAGLIAGTLAQVRKLDIEICHSSTCFAVYIHSLAGTFAQKKLGSQVMTATSLFDYLPQSFHEVSSGVIL